MNKKGVSIHMETLMYWIIGGAILILGIIIAFILKDKGINAVEYVKNLIRGFGQR